MLICLQESSDNFGPLVQRDINTLLETVKNVSVICSKSGKMSNKLINQWIGCLTNTYDNIDGQMNILLLLDSYSAHWNKEFDSAYNNEKFIINRKRYLKEPQLEHNL